MFIDNLSILVDLAFHCIYRQYQGFSNKFKNLRDLIPLFIMLSIFKKIIQNFFVFMKTESWLFRYRIFILLIITITITIYIDLNELLIRTPFEWILQVESSIIWITYSRVYLLVWDKCTMFVKVIIFFLFLSKHRTLLFCF